MKRIDNGTASQLVHVVLSRARTARTVDEALPLGHIRHAHIKAPSALSPEEEGGIGVLGIRGRSRGQADELLNQSFLVKTHKCRYSMS